MAGYPEVWVPQPERKTEVPRSLENDQSRVAVVDELCRKHGLTFKRRRGVPTIVHATAHGVRSFTFFTPNKAGMRAS